MYILAYLSKGLKMGNGKEGGKKEKKEENHIFCIATRRITGKEIKGRGGIKSKAAQLYTPLEKRVYLILLKTSKRGAN